MISLDFMRKPACLLNCWSLLLYFSSSILEHIVELLVIVIIVFKLYPRTYFECKIFVSFVATFKSLDNFNS